MGGRAGQAIQQLRIESQGTSLLASVQCLVAGYHVLLFALKENSVQSQHEWVNVRLSSASLASVGLKSFG